ncbi:two-component system histidine kinase PnpS [Paenibacillus sp. NPDC058071]|uniref:two-component system histidine kinase PnpS n=1 Tax=Paenibacillus sp. NPDC058071 TaxID=3346326 RepID=UPI0036DF4C36
MNSFRNRLTFIMIGMIALSVTAAGFIMAKTFKDTHIQTLEDSMVREMQIVLSKMDWKEGDTASLIPYFTDEADVLKSYTGERVTFIAGDGTVLGDSDFAAKSMDNHQDRLEVAEAHRTGVGREIRYSDTLKENLLYVAIATDPSNPSSNVIRLAVSLNEVEQSIYRLWTVLIIGLLILFLVAAFISYRIALSLTRPLEQITRVAQRIKHMDYKARVNVDNRGRGEIGELGHAINTMAESLEVQMTRIRENESQLESVLDNMINGVIMIEDTGKIVLISRRAEELLGFSSKEMVGRNFAEAKQQFELSQLIQEGLTLRETIREEITFYFPEERLLELHIVPIYHDVNEFGGVLLVLQDVTAIRRLERMRSEFVANVSHELKTPVAAVKGFAETLLGGGVKDEETARSFLQIIFDESERLNRLIGDILELSKIESRRVPLYFSPVEVDAFIAKIVTMMEPEAQKKSIRLEVQLENGLYVEADEDRLGQIVINLLANGINYTPEGGKVSLVVWAIDDDRIGVKISDTGIGIPKKDVPRIFERFYRVDKARSRSSGGTGLGLSIVKHLVELHKGTITVSSTVGVGSTFVIELPVLQQ